MKLHVSKQNHEQLEKNLWEEGLTRPEVASRRSRTQLWQEDDDERQLRAARLARAAQPGWQRQQGVQATMQDQQAGRTSMVVKRI